MNLKFKREKSSWLKLPAAVPVSEEMKRDLDRIKKAGVDVNSMTREYWQMLIDKAKTQGQAS